MTRNPRLVCAVLVSCLVLANACTTQVRPEPTVSLTASPSALIEDEIEDYVTGSGNLDNITSILVAVDGRTITEHYRRTGRPDQQTHLWSVTKSFLSTLVGIAHAEGKLDLDEPLRQLLPAHRSAMSRQVSGITTRQLMTMTAGIAGDEALGGLADTNVDTLLRLPLESKPGTEFRYSSLSAHLVAVVLTEAVGEPLLDYARDKLFDPMDISTRPAYTGTEFVNVSPAFDRAGFAWARSTDGIYHGCCLMKLTGRDMQKLGQLYLDDGRWQGRQLVPASWVKLATSSTKIAPDYGYLWWVNTVGSHDAYAAIGRDGQIISVIPDLRAVITVSSQSNPNLPLDPEMIFPLIEDVIVPRIS